MLVDAVGLSKPHELQCASDALRLPRRCAHLAGERATCGEGVGEVLVPRHLRRLCGVRSWRTMATIEQCKEQQLKA